MKKTSAGVAEDKSVMFNTININSELMKFRLCADVVVLPHDEDLAFSDGHETQTVHLHNRKHHTTITIIHKHTVNNNRKHTLVFTCPGVCVGRAHRWMSSMEGTGSFTLRDRYPWAGTGMGPSV